MSQTLPVLLCAWGQGQLAEIAALHLTAAPRLAKRI
jgi:hypothetical protein